jgi:copper transport protein
MSAWVGGLALVATALLPRREPAELRAALPMFSRVAFVSVSTLAVTGTYAAWRGIGSLRAILHTNYGLLISAKVILFLGLLALGNLSRLAIQRRIVRMPVAYAMTDVDADIDADSASEDDAEDAAEDAAEDDPPPLDDVVHERMRRSVLVELALAAIVLLATSVLVNQPRGREALAADDRKPVAASTSLGGGRTVTVTLEPGVHGPVTASIALTPGAKPQSVTATALQPSKQIGPLPIPLTANGTDLYGSSNVNLPVSGTWVVTVIVTLSKFNAVTTDVKIHLH